MEMLHIHCPMKNCLLIKFLNVNNFVLSLIILICKVKKRELFPICRLKVTNLLKTNNFVLPVNTSCVGLCGL